MRDYFLEIKKEQEQYAKIDKWAEVRKKKVAEKIIKLKQKQSGIIKSK